MTNKTPCCDNIRANVIMKIYGEAIKPSIHIFIMLHKNQI